MVQFFAEVLRGVGYRDNNWKPLASNDPTVGTIGWTKDAGVTATSDGDILSLSGTTSTNGVVTNVPTGLLTNTYPYIVVRAKADSSRTLDILVNYTSGSSTFTMNLTTSFQTFSFPLTAGKTISAAAAIKFRNQSSSGVNSLDYVYVCASPQVQLSQRDLKDGTVTRTSLGNDHAELELNNWGGRFTASMFGTGGPNAIGFGDHLHIYLGQGATLFHVYGGYVELENPVHPPDNMMLHSRGFGLALLRSKVLQIYNSSTPRTIINDELDSFVNNASKNNLLDTNNATIPSGYQLTRSFVQNIGSSLPLFVSSLNNAYNTFHELADLTVYQGNPAIFFVDPAENLHWA